MSIVVILALVLVAALLISSPSVGKAANLPGIENINLTGAGMYQIALPAESLSTEITASLNAEESQTFDLIVENQDDENYLVTLNLNDILVAQDLLAADGDSSSLYLDDADAQADLEVSIVGNQLSLRNLHFSAPDRSAIRLLREDGTPYLSVIRVQPGSQFSAVLEAVSSSTPDFTIVDGDILDIEEEDNRTTARYVLDIPDEPQSFVVDIISTVQGLETHAYFTFAVDGVVYQFDQEGSPAMNLRVAEDGSGELEVRFRATKDIQPFSLPCMPDETSLDALFADTDVRHVYSYDPVSAERLIWTNGAPSDFDQISVFKSYFVRLAHNDEETVTFSCLLEQPGSVENNLPDLAASRQQTLPAGWNPFSLPGTVPKPLNTFTSVENYELYTCGQNYRCEQIDVDTPLQPGRFYWISTPNRLPLRYSIE